MRSARTEDGVINGAPAEMLWQQFDTTEKVDAAFAELKEYWDKLLSHFTMSSFRRKARPYGQCLAPVPVYGYLQHVPFRFLLTNPESAVAWDSVIPVRIFLDFVHLIPDRARERILDIAATQFEDGSAYHQYQPLTKKGNAGYRKRI